MNEIRTTQAFPSPDVIDLGIGQPGLALLPLDMMKQAAEIRLGSGDGTLLNYGYELGDGYFRIELSRFLSRYYGFVVPDDGLMTTCGVSQALDLICTRFTEPGDVVFVEEPTYFLALRIFADHQLQIVGLPVDSEGLDIEAVQAALAELRPVFLYTIPTYQNPSGVTLSAERRQKLVELSQEHDFLIVADEVYHLLNYEAGPPPPLAAFLDCGNVLSAGSFSKILAPGLRLGWIQAVPELLQKLVESGLVDSGGGLNPFTSNLVKVVLERGWQDVYLRQLKDIYGSRLETMNRALEQYVVEGLSFAKPAGGFFFWLGLDGDVSASDLLPAAEAHGVSFNSGHKFSPSQSLGNFLRLSFAYYGEDEISEGVARLGRALEAFRQRL